MKTFMLAVLLAAFAAPSAAQGSPRTTPQSVREHFASVNRRVLAMAKDFPEDRYGFRLKPEMRSFAEVIVHIASGNLYAAKTGTGHAANWDEADAKNYKTKAEVVALLEKSIHDADATFRTVKDASMAKTIEPWISVIVHASEHYGLLVAYYRANGLVPPESRQP